MLATSPFLFSGGIMISEYQLELKQLVDYPRCRIYREFIQSLIKESSIRADILHL